MLQVQNLTFGIGERLLLKDVTVLIQPNKRVALIGPNGTGKTTFLKLLLGDLAPLQGSIIKPKDYIIGYLPQEDIELEQNTLLASVLSGRKELVEIEDKTDELRRQLELSGGTDSRLLDQLGDLEHRYEALGGYYYENEAKAILSGLGFDVDQYHQPVSVLSGGWRMRVLLARILLQKPDLLLLDEPTNHLDIPSLEWLEQHLMNFIGSVILVSHDRFFIERLAQDICELDRGKLTFFPGKYHDYERSKAQREELLEKQWQQQKVDREKQQRFIERFRYKATKAAQVQSRINALEKLELIELPPIKRAFHFQLSVEKPSYKHVLQIENMWFRYQSEWVLRDISMNLYRGDRIALVGANGAGKTTLTRLIVGQLQPQKGLVRLGERAQIGYYAQHQIDNLNLQNTAYQEVVSAISDSMVPKVRDVLGLFQFSGDDVFKPIQVLSGGEKARVSLAKILLSPVNFLIMDEPTNHLDLTSKEALEQALAGYEGTVILISHDRYFLDKLVNRVFELEEGQLFQYEGNYSDYLNKKMSLVAAASSSVDDDAVAVNKKLIKRFRAEARQAISQDRKKLHQEIESLEHEIEHMEQRKSELEVLMARPETFQNGEYAASIAKEYQLLQAQLPILLQKWEATQLELEALLAELEQKLAMNEGLT